MIKREGMSFPSSDSLPRTLAHRVLRYLTDMKSHKSFFFGTLLPAFLLPAGPVFAAAQNRGPQYAPPTDDWIFGSVWFYLFMIIALAVVGYFIKSRMKKEAETHEISPRDGGLRMTYREKPAAKPVFDEPEPVTTAPAPPVKKGFTSLPVASFVRLQRSNAYVQLHESTDPSLLRAIEESNVDVEEDVTVRMGALKVLSDFRTSNSVSAIAQMALYDLSAKVRSDAVLQLAEVDHESVFETIVTCCADPTREVRASAARALSKLTFDRAEAWTRIVESRDLARMRHAARSAVEGDLVGRYFDRLVHQDRKNAYEAFAVIVLLIRSGETGEVFTTLSSHRNEDVKLAILHILQCLKDDHTSEWLEELLTRHDLSPTIHSRVSEMRLQFHAHPV